MTLDSESPRRVAVWSARCPSGVVLPYSESPPFHPDRHFPELDGSCPVDPTNAVYGAVRETLALHGLDIARFGTCDWNPLGAFIKLGQTVLLKPNLVMHCHPRDPEGWKYTVTHGSVVRAVADYVWKATGPGGRVLVADSPQCDAQFADLAERTGLLRIAEHYRDRGFDFRLIDLRREEWTTRDAVIVARRVLPGDPLGYAKFDLQDRSELWQHKGEGRYYGADYDAAELNRHHSGGRHEYLVARTAIDADVVISIPKLKTHKKAGVTASLKSLVGINGDKNWLPHHTEGFPSSGGDEHPNPSAVHRLERKLVQILHKGSLRYPSLGTLVHRTARAVGSKIVGDSEKVIRSGNWWGNDTCWRMCLDLNKVLFYGRSDGTLREPVPTARKPHLAVVDAWWSGQGSGPINCDPAHTHFIAFGSNPASVDAACSRLIGFNPELIPIVREAFRCQAMPLAEWTWRDVLVASNDPEWNLPLADIPYDATYHFRPHFGWLGHIEQQPG